MKDADPVASRTSRRAGLLVREGDYTHSYPHCWRCGTPLIYWAKPTWFASTSARKDDLLRENETVDWHPEHIKHGRFGDWLENNVDWALSRERFWGTPIPVWRCRDLNTTCASGRSPSCPRSPARDLGDLDLHRPDVDEIVLACSECGGRAQRIEPVLDAWFDSGAVPASQFHYPFEGTDVFEQRFPADFVCEAIDQTRGWFYSLLAVNTLVFEHAPYRHVVCLAHIVDRDGQKMSKSRGNVIDPWTILETHGADALRWYFFSAGSPWTNRRVYEEGIEEATRRMLLTLWNTYYFFVTYANLDGWEPDGAARAPSHVLDRWARSRLHGTVRDVTTALEGFDAYAGAQAVERLVDDLSNWYVRRSRPRFWKSTDPDAHATLHECLRTVTKLLAPFCPFVTDEVHVNLARTTESVHLADWPETDIGAIDESLEAAMAAVRQDRRPSAPPPRTEAKLKVRRPLRRALVLAPDPERLTPELVDEIADELNVKEVELVTDLEGLLDYSVIPVFRRLGPKVGPLMPKVKDSLATADAAEVRRALERDGEYCLSLGDGDTVTLGPDDVEVRADAHGELTLARDGAYAVALDTTLDDELRREGLARETSHAPSTTCARRATQT